MAIEIAELIGQLRAELEAATDAGQGSELMFELGPVDLELTVTVSKEAKPTAKVRFWVVELGAEGKVSAGHTQKIKLTLEPRRAADPDRRPWVAGDEVGGEIDDRDG